MPAFAWTKRLNSSRADVLYTFFDGTSWSTEFVATADGGIRSSATLGFDLSGNPAIAYHHWNNSSDGGVKLARRSDFGQWNIEVADLLEGAGSTTWPGKGIVALDFDANGRPALAYSVDVDGQPGDWDETDLLRFAILSDASWNFEEVEASLGADVGWAAQLRYDPDRGDFSILHIPNAAAIYCNRGSSGWQCGKAFVGEPPDFGVTAAYPDATSFIVPRWMAIDGDGQTFVTYQFGRSVRLARSADGGIWTHEFIDCAWLWPEFEQEPFGVNPIGPFIALDPSGTPSLSWMWTPDDWQPGDPNLYFAWQDSTPIVCGDGDCNGVEDPCSCPEDCGTPLSTELGLCTDFSDNDCDTFVDCIDSDCYMDPACPYCGDGYCDPSESSCSCPADCGSPAATELFCSDGLDDDCDTFVDCNDSDCAEDEACVAGGGLPGDPCTSGADCLSGLCHPVKHTCK